MKRKLLSALVGAMFVLGGCNSLPSIPPCLVTGTCLPTPDPRPTPRPTPTPSPTPCPTPTPTPEPTPTPTPTPRPTPTPSSCPALTNLKVQAHQSTPTSYVVDATPRGPDCTRCASINKGCDNGVCPLGPEGTPEFDAQRMACEDLYGPYEFTFSGTRADGSAYNGPCTEQDACFHQSDNPLSVKVNGHGTVSVKAKNGVGNSVVIP